MKTYQITQKLNWCCPEMLIFIDDDNKIIGNQQNPTNALTQNWAEDNEDWGDFDPDAYLEVIEL